MYTQQFRGFVVKRKGWRFAWILICLTTRIQSVFVSNIMLVIHVCVSVNAGFIETSFQNRLSMCFSTQCCISASAAQST